MSNVTNVRAVSFVTAFVIVKIMTTFMFVTSVKDVTVVIIVTSFTAITIVTFVTIFIIVKIVTTVIFVTAVTNVTIVMFVTTIITVKIQNETFKTNFKTLPEYQINIKSIKKNADF